MQSKDRIILQKIVNYIKEVENYIEGLTTEVFMGDKKTITACAFTVSQIGELSNDISDETQTKYDNIPWKAMKGMRNKIIHDYENIDLAVLWATIQKSLPELKLEIEKMIFENTEEII